jgi:GWxTD domain-containing protein
MTRWCREQAPCASLQTKEFKMSSSWYRPPVTRKAVAFATHLFVITSCVFAQTPGVQLQLEAKEVDFNVAFLKFDGDSNHVFVEMCYSFYQDVLEVSQEDSQKTVAFGISAKFYRGDSLHAVRAWNGRSLVLDEDNNEELFSLSNLMLSPGVYDVVTHLKDLTSGREKTKRLKVSLPDFAPDRLSVSDIQLAHSIVPDTSGNIFSKNGYRVVPNPRQSYDVRNPILYFYSEIYRLSLTPEATYQVEYAILDRTNEPVKTFPSKRRTVKAASLVEVGGLNVIQLATGDYNLQLKITDDTNGTQVIQKAPFHFLRKLKEEPTFHQKRMNHLVAMYANYEEKQLDDEFDKVRYIITSEEKRIYKSLKLEGKRTFMADFWFKRDQMPETLDNEHRDAYFSRVQQTNERFGAIGNGWRKDRGRVFILYGEPDEVEKSHAVTESRSFETWRYYYVESGVIFVFVDKSDSNNLELVHSTAQGEIRNTNWESWLYGRGR